MSSAYPHALSGSSNPSGAAAAASTPLPISPLSPNALQLEQHNSLAPASLASSVAVDPLAAMAAALQAAQQQIAQMQQQQIAAAAAAAPAPASGSRKHRRSSLPPPVSGSYWTELHLRGFNIDKQPASLEQLLSAGGAFKVKAGYQQSAKSKAVAAECANITLNSVLMMGEEPAHLPSVAHKLFKYLRLIRGPGGVRSGLESVVDDLVIHLLDALGFNDGNLVILSKNKLRLEMNKLSNACATADVTVLDIESQFRLAVAEHKRNEDCDLGDVEAQLIAEAVAAAQHNLKISQNHKRARAGSADSKQQAEADPIKVEPGVMFLLRVLGDAFSFYSVSFDEHFVQIVEEYSRLETLAPKGLPHTHVWKFQLVVAPHAAPAAAAADAAAAAAPPALRPQSCSQFLFSSPQHRAIILDVLDHILHQIS